MKVKKLLKKMYGNDFVGIFTEEGFINNFKVKDVPEKYLYKRVDTIWSGYCGDSDTKVNITLKDNK